MTEPEAQFSALVRRIEVFAGPLEAEAPDEFIWSIAARPLPDNAVGVWGYMRRSSSDGYGQVQALGVLTDRTWEALDESSESRKEFREWMGRYGSEVLFDTARRALQVQAALMDFAFDIDTQAPPAKVKIRRPEEDQSDDDELQEDDVEQE